MAFRRSNATPPWRRPALWLALVAVAIVLVLFSKELEQPSPGPLSAVHARVDGLAGGASCAACHGGFAEELAAACGRCHGDVLADLRAREGLHGRLAPALAAECGRCHSEHHGADFELVSDAAFALAGVADRAAFEHRAFGIEIHGRHDELACAACHEHADAPLLPVGARRFGGLDASCASCHRDPHEGALGPSCSDCHGQREPFAAPADFAHARFDAGGAHAGAECRACHEPRSATSIERAFAAGPEQSVRTCGACHAQPHMGDLLAAGAIAFQTTAERSCGGCHDPRDGHFAVAPGLARAAGGAGALLWSGRPPASRVTPAVHARAGFALDGAHAALDCVRCHGAEAHAADDFAERYPGRERGDCAACHADAHRGEFAGGAFADARCADCHSDTAFRPARFDLASHARTGFALEGAHGAVACGACHADAHATGARSFAGLAGACADCHVDPHRGAFDASGSDCARCHGPTAFDAVDRRTFDHDLTGFRLAGAHAAASCESCHPASAPVGPERRTFGVASEHFGLGDARGPERCDACHADAHRGAFERGAASPDCAACHTVDAFAPATAPFDHGARTGFDLSGGHGGLDCAACHVVPATGPHGARGLGLVRGTACADCHGDPHRGQFEGGATSCARCHDGAERLVFDHERDARFALGPQHGDVDCASCHRPWPLADGGSTVRYRPLGRRCVDCHGTVGGR